MIVRQRDEPLLSGLLLVFAQWEVEVTWDFCLFLLY